MHQRKLEAGGFFELSTPGIVARQKSGVDTIGQALAEATEVSSNGSHIYVIGLSFSLSAETALML